MQNRAKIISCVQQEFFPKKANVQPFERYNILLADTSIPRKHEDEIKKYIENKYHIHVQVIPLKVLGGIVTYK